jgi:hypothetical protein
MQNNLELDGFIVQFSNGLSQNESNSEYVHVGAFC